MRTKGLLGDFPGDIPTHQMYHVQANRMVNKNKKTTKSVSNNKQVNAYKGPLNNTDKDAANDIYKLGQVIHHSFNWVSPPKGVDKLFNNVADSIHPAQDVNKQASARIKAIIKNCAWEVTRYMADHYDSQITYLAAIIKQPSKLAYDVAVNRLKKKFRLHDQFLENLHGKVFSTAYEANCTLPEIVLLPHTPLLTSSPVRTIANDQPAAEGVRRRLSMDAEVVHISTQPAAITTTTTVNAKPPTMTTPVVVTLPPRTHQRHRSSPAAPNPNSSPAIVNAYIHPAPRTGVAHSGINVTIKPTTRFLILGDSNLRHLKLATADTQIECIPGAKLCHINEVIERTISKNTHPELRHIFLNVGINDRDNVFKQTTQKNLTLLANTIKTKGFAHSFIALPTPSTNICGANVIDNVNATNTHAAKLYNHFLVLKKDEIVQTDKFGIHLSDNALIALAQSITSTIKEINNSNITKYLTQKN